MVVKMSDVIDDMFLFLCDFYRLGKPIESAAKFDRGEDNLNYRITTDKGVYVARFYLISTPQQVDYELNFVRYLVQNGYRSPDIIETPEGKLFSMIKDGPVAVFRFVDGVHKEQADKNDLFEIGGAMADLHILSAKWQWEDHRRKGNIDILRRILDSNDGVNQNGDPYPKDFGTLKNLVADFLEENERRIELIFNSAPSGCIHHDFNLDNILFTRTGKIAGILDFDECNFAPFAVDIAAAFHYLCVTPEFRTLDFEKCDHFLRGYFSNRPISSTEKESLSTLWEMVNLVSACDTLRRGDIPMKSIYECHSLDSFLKNRSCDFTSIF